MTSISCRAIEYALQQPCSAIATGMWTPLLPRPAGCDQLAWAK